EYNKRPRLAPGVRLGENNQQRVLLMPERALRLIGPSLEIVQRCDGRHTIQQIVAELQALYAKADPAKVESDILGYLQLLQTERAAGLYVNLITSGLPLDEPKLDALIAAGLDHFQLSFQGAEPQIAAEISNTKSHAQKLRVLDWLKSRRVALTLNFVIHRQ